MAAGGDAPQGCPVQHEGKQGSARAEGCPVSGGEAGGLAANMMPKSSNSKAPGQEKDLGRARMVSSIPMSSSTQVPGHQPEGADSPNWVYPSEQMFYNAMKRKGWDAKEDDMATVVKIHNAVNEKAWREVLAWEANHCDTCPAGPKLLRFMGRPRDYSPKARLLNLLGYKLPFDRHDWVVDRCGTEVRYVIDFYGAKPGPFAPAAMHLDVRPALDSAGALWDRVKMQLKWVGSGRWARDEAGQEAQARLAAAAAAGVAAARKGEGAAQAEKIPAKS